MASTRPSLHPVRWTHDEQNEFRKFVASAKNVDEVMHRIASYTKTDARDILQFFQDSLIEKFLNDFNDWEEIYNNSWLYDDDDNLVLVDGILKPPSKDVVGKTVAAWDKDMMDQDLEVLQKKANQLQEKEKTVTNGEEPMTLAEILANTKYHTFEEINLSVAFPPRCNKTHKDIEIKFPVSGDTGMALGTSVDSIVSPSDDFLVLQHMIQRKHTHSNSESNVFIQGLHKEETIVELDENDKTVEMTVPCVMSVMPYTKTEKLDSRCTMWSAENINSFAFFKDKNFHEVIYNAKIFNIIRKKVGNRERYFASIKTDTPLYKLITEPGYFRKMLRDNFKFSIVKYKHIEDEDEEEITLVIPLAFVVKIFHDVSTFSVENRMVHKTDRHILRIFKANGKPMSSGLDVSTKFAMKICFWMLNEEGYLRLQSFLEQFLDLN